MKIKRLLLLDWKRLLLIVVAWFVFVVLHNLISGLFHTEEGLFFILAVLVLPAYFLVALVYTAVYRIKVYMAKSKRKN